MRPIFRWSILLLVILVSIGCRRQPAAPASATIEADRPAAQTGDGLQITPLGAGHDETAEILGIQRWRFQIVCHMPDGQLLHAISLRNRGQWITDLAGGLSRWSANDTGEQMIVAVYPLDGDLHISTRLKTYVRIGDSTFTSIRDNPLKGQRGITHLPVAKRQPDGSFLLIQSSDRSNDPNGDGAQLVLRISMSKTEEPPSSPY